MTARQLIFRIVDSCQDWDEDVRLFILTRDEENCVTNEKLCNYSFVNGKIYVEEGGK